MIHLLRIDNSPYSPESTPTFGDVHIFLIKIKKHAFLPSSFNVQGPKYALCDASEPPEHLCMATRDTRLKDAGFIKPGKDHIFIIDDGPRRLYLILRMVHAPTTFKLVTMCEEIFFPVYRQTRHNEGDRYEPSFWNPIDINAIHYDVNKYVYPYGTKYTPMEPVPSIINMLPLDSLRFLARSNADHEIKSKLQRYWKDWEDGVGSLIPGTPDLRQTLAVFQGLLNDTRGVQPDFINCYKTATHRYRPTQDMADNTMVITLPKGDKETIQQLKDGRDNDNDRLWHSWAKTAQHTERRTRAYVTKLEAAFRSHKIFGLLKEISLTNTLYDNPRNNEASLLLREENIMQYDRAYPRWERDLVDTFRIDGSTYKITIV